MPGSMHTWTPESWIRWRLLRCSFWGENNFSDNGCVLSMQRICSLMMKSFAHVSRSDHDRLCCGNWRRTVEEKAVDVHVTRYIGLFIVLVGLFIVLVGLFIVLVGLFIVLVGLFIVLVGLFIVSVGLFMVLVGLFIVLVGLFIVLVGLFIVLVGLFIVLVGLFIVVLADSE
jgi:hypothetical protein